MAKPRAESVMRQFARDMTGSRVGFRNQPLEVFDGPSNGAFGKPGSRNQLDVPPSAEELYGQDGGLRRLSTYWQQQDRLLEGNVEVGPLQNVPTPKGETAWMVEAVSSRRMRCTAERVRLTRTVHPTSGEDGAAVLRMLDASGNAGQQNAWQVVRRRSSERLRPLQRQANRLESIGRVSHRYRLSSG